MDSATQTSEEVRAKIVAEVTAELQAKWKKKTVNLLKRQQAEFEEKLQAVEDRANKAESALALVKANENLENELSKLKTELEEERVRYTNFEGAAHAEKQRLEAQLSELKVLLEESSKKKSKREDLVKELEDNRATGQKQIEELTRINQQLEAQLLAAAGQVSEAFSRISSSQDEMERMSKEGHETKLAHTRLLEDYNRLSVELEKSQTAFEQAQKEIVNKTKHIEEITEARTIAQEGQKSAVDQLLKQLSEIEVQRHEALEPNTRLPVSVNERTVVDRDSKESQGHMELQIDKLDVIEASILADVNSTDALVRAIYELKFQNEFLKSQLNLIQSERTKKLKNIGSDVDLHTFENLQKQIAYISEQLEQSKLLQISMEEQNKNKDFSCSELEKKIQELSSDLDEVRCKMEITTKERDELDAKFVRLQKRAKQRIQELQKEKDDIESQLSAANEKSTHAIAEQFAIRQELESTRRQAAEALRSLDAEKQILRNTNNSQKEQIEELQQRLNAQEHAIEELNQNISEKDKMLHDLQNSLKSTDERHQALIMELNSKHQKNLEDLEAQLAEVTSERAKAAQEITKLQSELAVRESNFAALEAASTGEAARLGAALEAVKGEVARAKQEHSKEKENWEAAIQTYRLKLEESEKARSQYEIDIAKNRSHFESEVLGLRQLLKRTEDELASSKLEINHLEEEFKAYKSRAHVLLQKKDAELSAVKDTELLAAQEAALKEAQREAALALTERDRAQQALEDAVKFHETELAARSVALIDAEQRIKDVTSKMESMKAQFQLEKEAWQNTLSAIQESWHLKCEALEVQVRSTATEGFNADLISLRENYEKLKEEHESFQEMANNIIETKDKEIARLLNDNNNLQKSLHAKKQVNEEHEKVKAIPNHDSHSVAVAAAEQQILLLARQQAQREEELAQCHRHIQVLQEEIEELEHENRLHRQQETMLKDELRNMERVQKRGNVDMTYLKNVILKLLETGEVEALLPVIGTLLQFSPDEIRKCQETYNVRTSVPSSGTAPGIDDAAATPSFFARFTFSNGK